MSGRGQEAMLIRRRNGDSLIASTAKASWRPELAVFVVAVAATVLFWLVVPPTFFSASPATFAALNSDYEYPVRYLISGVGGFGARYPPGFPLVLAAVYHSARLVHLPLGVALSVFILGCSGLSCVLLYRLAAEVWGTRSALVTALLWATFVLPLWLTTYPSPESPFTPALFGAVLVFWGALVTREAARRRLFFAGVMAGLAMLIRPIAMGLSVVFAAVLWWFRRDLTRRTRLNLVAVLVGANLLTILPWEAWVYMRQHRLVPLSTGGFPSVIDGLTFAVDPKDHRTARIPDDVAALQSDILARYHELGSVGATASYLREQFGRRPGAVVKLFVIKAANSWYATDSTKYDRTVLLVQVAYLSLVLTGTIGAWKMAGRPRQLAILIWCVSVWFWMMTITALSIARYMTPALGLLLALVPGVNQMRLTDGKLRV